jgi:hypothetical protein
MKNGWVALFWIILVAGTTGWLTWQMWDHEAEIMRFPQKMADFIRGN